MTHEEKVAAIRRIVDHDYGRRAFSLFSHDGLEPSFVAHGIADAMAKRISEHPRIAEMVVALKSGELDQEIAAMLGYA